MGTNELSQTHYKGRDEIWLSFLRGLKERPIFGHGFQTKPMRDDWETLRNMPGQVAKSAHSAPIEYGTTTGVLGLLLFLWLLWGGLRGILKPGYRGFGGSAIVFWLCSCPIYLLYAHGNAPSAPAVWPLWVLLLTCLSVNGQPARGQVAPPWVLRISRQEEGEFRAALPPFSSEAFGEARRKERKAIDDSE
jgi:O-antigen ligase